MVITHNLIHGFDVNEDELTVLGHELERAGVKKSVLKDPKFNASQLLACRDAWSKQVSDGYGDMGNYRMGETTASMGSVLDAMTGTRDKRGQYRKRD